MATKDDHDVDETETTDPEVDEETQDETEPDEDIETEDEDAETDDDQDDDEGDSSFTKRFTQFKGDTPAEYAAHLEDAYSKSSTEAVRLARENKELKPLVERVQALIATNPELAKQLGQPTTPTTTTTPDPSLDPDLAWAKGERQRQWAKELNDFKGQHPELDSDPALAEELNAELSLVAEVYQRQYGYGISMAEGLRKAWAALGHDNSPSKQERIAKAAKDGGVRSKSATGGRTSAPKVKLSEKQIEVAMEMMHADRNTAIKRLSTYVK